MVLQLLCTEMPGEGPQERACWGGGSHRPLLCSPPLVVPEVCIVNSSLRTGENSEGSHSWI